MPSPKQLTREAIIRTARTFRWFRKMPKWTAIVEGRELPARPLVLEAAGVPPNDPTNSHQAVDILKTLGFETRYSREYPGAPTNEETEPASIATSLASILEIASTAAEEVPQQDWDRVPDDLSLNVDHYLYGAKKTS